MPELCYDTEIGDTAHKKKTNQFITSPYKGMGIW